MIRLHTALTILLLGFLFVSCRGDKQEAKSDAHPQIARDSVTWLKYENPYLSIHYPSDASLEVLVEESEGKWFSIEYPTYEATIYCSFLPITYQSLGGAIEDSYRFAYSHAGKATDIQQVLYEDSVNNVAGIVYHIEGEVATPMQFFVTDSTQHFFRASLYYNRVMNLDSIAPTTRLLKSDVEKLIQSVRWK